MSSINRVFIMGYLGADPEPHQTRKGKPYIRMSVSTHRAWKNDDGELEKQTMWHRVTAYGKNAESCQNHLRRGSPVALEGYLTKYSYEKEGAEVSATGIVAQQVHFMPKREAPSFEPSFDGASAAP